jgi:molybdenum cofactor cytidylyltransferase
MGRPKQLLDWGGQPLVRVVAQAALAANLDHVSVVVGNAANEVTAALAELPVQIIVNPDFAAGQSTSLRVGVAALPPSTAAALVLLVDQPFVTSAIINTLVDHWHASRAPIVVPFYAGQRGHPVLFSHILFPELLNVTGDQGARHLMQHNKHQIESVHFDQPFPLYDIDTPEEYQRYLTLQPPTIS